TGILRGCFSPSATRRSRRGFPRCWRTDMAAWEEIYRETYDRLERLEVPGGWLYRAWVVVDSTPQGSGGGKWGLSIALVPVPTAPPPMNVDVPYVSGTGAVGSTLTCTMGNWEGAPTSYSYAWSGSGTATGDTYVVGAADAGTSITCIVTAT